MSRTDKTRPYWVRKEDSTDPAAHAEARYWGKNICGCKLCTSQYWNREERRRTRHNKRRDIEERNESY